MITLSSCCIPTYQHALRGILPLRNLGAWSRYVSWPVSTIRSGIVFAVETLTRLLSQVLRGIRLLSQSGSKGYRNVARYVCRYTRGDSSRARAKSEYVASDITALVEVSVLGHTKLSASIPFNKEITAELTEHQKTIVYPFTGGESLVVGKASCLEEVLGGPPFGRLPTCSCGSCIFSDRNAAKLESDGITTTLDVLLPGRICPIQHSLKNIATIYGDSDITHVRLGERSVKEAASGADGLRSFLNDSFEHTGAGALVDRNLGTIELRNLARGNELREKLEDDERVHLICCPVIGLHGPDEKDISVQGVQFYLAASDCCYGYREFIEFSSSSFGNGYGNEYAVNNWLGTEIEGMPLPREDFTTTKRTCMCGEVLDLPTRARFCPFCGVGL